MFREIDPPSRIVYDNAWDLPGAPLDYSVVVALAEERGKTRMSLHMTFADDEAVKVAVERYGVLQGGVQTFERFASYVDDLRDSVADR